MSEGAHGGVSAAANGSQVVSVLAHFKGNKRERGGREEEEPER